MWGILMHTSAYWAYQILLKLSFFEFKEDMGHTSAYYILLKLSFFVFREDMGHTGAY
jgi:hypothetical protein